jgi:hypothetical protein
MCEHMLVRQRISSPNHHEGRPRLQYQSQGFSNSPKSSHSSRTRVQALDAMVQQWGSLAQIQHRVIQSITVLQSSLQVCLAVQTLR